MSPSTTGIEILRDRWGVAHVYAASEEALFYGAGYATAEDRMFQMMIRRRVATGRIAEILGPGSDGRHLDRDRLHRLFGFVPRAQANLARMDPGARACLEAYAAGVNAYLEGHRGRLLPVFARNGGEPEPWTAADCLAIWEDLGHRFSFGWQGEAKALREFEARGQRFPEDVPPETPARVDDSAQIVSEEEFRTSYPGAYERLMAKKRPRAAGASAPSQAPPKLSHNWCVSGARSTTGKPIIEGDPQYGVNNPSYWYEIHLTGGRYNVRGAGIPGCPAMLLYWNERIAIAPTGLGGDDGDLFMEKVDPADPGRYLYKGESLPFQRRREVIKVKGQAPVEFDVLISRHGPVVNDLLEGVKPGEVFALSQSNWAFGLTTVDAILESMRARDWPSFRSAMSRYASPPLHYVYADADNNIAHQVATATPIRFGPRALPRAGWTGQDEWKRVPFEEMPGKLNPPSNYIATANHLGAGSWYPYAVGAGTGDGPRSFRLREIFESDPARKFSVRDFVEVVHRDCVSSPARDLAALVRKIAAEDGVADPKVLAVVQLLEGWDGRLQTDDPAFAVGRGMLDALEARKLAGSGQESRYPEGWAGPNALLKDLMPPFRREGQTPKDARVREWIVEIAREAYDRRSAALRQQEDTTGWAKDVEASSRGAETGEAHSTEAFIRHMPYQDTPEGFGAERFGSFDSAADLESPPLRCPAIQTIWSQEGNSYCHIVDLANVDNSLSLLAPGLSEDPANPHFKDQMEIWAAGELHPAPLTRAAVEKYVESSTHLETKPRET